MPTNDNNHISYINAAARYLAAHDKPFVKYSVAPEMEWLQFERVIDDGLRSCKANVYRDNQPYNTIEEMYDDHENLDSIRYLENNHPLGQLYDKYRALHDVHHCEFRLLFTLKGELMAWRIMDTYLYSKGVDTGIRLWVRSDIVFNNVLAVAPEVAHYDWVTYKPDLLTDSLCGVPIDLL